MRSRRSFLLSAVAVVLAACGPASSRPVASTSAPVSASAVDPGNARGNKFLTVMSRNLYLGAELGPAMNPKLTPEQFVAATTEIWGMVQHNNAPAEEGGRIPARFEGVADEIAAVRPDLVGLQEAYTWVLTTPGKTEVVYDYAPDLVATLAARGLAYRVVATTTLSDITAPIMTGAGLGQIRMIDHEAILAREDVETANPAGAAFADENLMPVALPGTTLLIERGWASIDVKRRVSDRDLWFRFVSTHPEAYHPYFRTLQGRELAGILAAETRPIVLVGDLNSDPGAEAELALADAGLADVWGALYPDDPGFTSPYHQDLAIEPITLDERIDYVMVRGPVTPVAAGVVGTQPWERIVAADGVGRWPSDHAGLWTMFGLEKPQPVDLAQQ